MITVDVNKLHILVCTPLHLSLCHGLQNSQAAQHLHVLEHGLFYGAVVASIGHDNSCSTGINPVAAALPR